ncbi:MAG: helix-hairpin-helix domain-containing protein [Clostridiales bacterium]|jgi:DNA uptake protein ComE-like DNA-binding protein|nr:helix-hairpin-helix domain-containing protein [Clostridiales bacterium]
MKKLRGLSIIFILLFVLATIPPATISAQPFIDIREATSARVLQIIDVNAILVQTDEGQALVRLLGVSPGGSRAGINYLSREINGRYVSLATDPLLTGSLSEPGRWNYMYVYFEGRLINSEIVLSGYAKPNENHSEALLFDTIRQAGGIADTTGLGLWANEGRHPHIVRYLERINVNTASELQIQLHTGASFALARSIVTFRANAPFQQISDLKFVPGMTRDFFEQNRHRLGVSTNINTAVREELESIFSSPQAQAIINSRAVQNRGLFENTEQLVARGIMPLGIFNPRAPFVAVSDVYEIEFSRPGFRANMNLANNFQLTRAGTSVVQANAIVMQRQIMPIRNLQDLISHTGFISPANTNALGDNLRAFTNINTAPRSELESLFGTSVVSTVNLNRALNNIIEQREHTPFVNIEQIAILLPPGASFAAISPFIYVDVRPVPELVNINTAPAARLTELGLTPLQANQIVSSTGRGNWNFPSQLPPFIRNLPADIRAHFAVRTNINTAAPAELASLDAAMTPEIIGRIIEYREDQIFGSFAELQSLFTDLNQLPLYNRIMRFLILR